MEFTLISLLFVSILITAIFHGCAHYWLSRKAPQNGTLHPISILKPLCGLDDELYDNLVSFVEQDYPQFQLVFGTEDPEDPALDAVRKLQANYPDVDIAVVMGANWFGLNPKVTNLASLATQAKHELWLISDSNVRVTPDYLTKIGREIAQPDVGMVCSVFRGVGEQSAGALFENIHLNSWMPGGMCATQIITNEACVTGKSMLFRRTDLDRIGGWSSVKDILAEDYILGRKFAQLGLKVVTSRALVTTVNSQWTFKRFINRHLRWATLRRNLQLPAYALEPIINPVLWGFILIACGLPLYGAAAILFKTVSDAFLAKRVNAKFYPLAYYFLIPVKDMIFAGLWAVGLFRKKINWRGHNLEIGRGSRLIGDAETVEKLAVVAARLQAEASNESVEKVS